MKYCLKWAYLGENESINVHGNFTYVYTMYTHIDIFLYIDLICLRYDIKLITNAFDILGK